MISVCIAMHNGGNYILEELESILPQIGPNDEVIISDDGSTDDCLRIVNDIGDPRIKIFKYCCDNAMPIPRYYVTKNIENALKHARGEYIFMADQDDIWMPHKVETVIYELQKYDLVLSELLICNGNSELTGEKWYSGKFRRNNPLKIFGKTYLGCSMAFKRCVLDAALPFPPKILSHDHWIGYVAEIIGKVKYIEQPLMYYRIHDHNVSGDSRSPFSFWFKISYRLYMIKEFVKVRIKR